MIPDIDFTTLQLNVAPTDIAKYFTRTDGNTLYYEITLVRKPMACPLCEAKMIGHGYKQKKISHLVVRDWNGVILYHANRYLCFLVDNEKKHIYDILDSRNKHHLSFL